MAAINPKRRADLHAALNGRCGYCGRSITLKEMQIDHMMPQRNPSLSTVIIDGKRVSQLHHNNNLMPACKSCNHYKRAATVEGFRLMMTTLHERLAAQYTVKVARNYGIVRIEPWNGVFYFEKIKYKQ